MSAPAGEASKTANAVQPYLAQDYINDQNRTAKSMATGALIGGGLGFVGGHLTAAGGIEGGALGALAGAGIGAIPRTPELARISAANASAGGRSAAMGRAALAGGLAMAGRTALSPSAGDYELEPAGGGAPWLRNDPKMASHTPGIPPIPKTAAFVGAATQLTKGLVPTMQKLRAPLASAQRVMPLKSPNLITQPKAIAMKPNAPSMVGQSRALSPTAMNTLAGGR